MTGENIIFGMRCGKNILLSDSTWTRYIYSYNSCGGKPNDTPCDDGNVCTQTDTCQSGTCVGSNPVVCTALDQCHDVGTCDATSGCSQPFKSNGTSCDDNNVCTQTDTCQSGTCVGSNPVICTALDQCHDAGTCNTTSGQCSQPFKSNNSTCDDGDSCTDADVCISGVCMGTSSCPVATPENSSIRNYAPRHRRIINGASQLHTAQYLGIAICLVEIFL